MSVNVSEAVFNEQDLKNVTIPISKEHVIVSCRS